MQFVCISFGKQKAKTKNKIIKYQNFIFEKIYKIPCYKVPGFFRKSKCSSKKIIMMFHIHASKLIMFPPNIKK